MEKLDQQGAKTNQGFSPKKIVSDNNLSLQKKDMKPKKRKKPKKRQISHLSQNKFFANRRWAYF